MGTGQAASPKAAYCAASRFRLSSTVVDLTQAEPPCFAVGFAGAALGAEISVLSS